MCIKEGAIEILKTRKNKPPRILVHGDHKTGKSSLAASAPNPIFINIEDGLDNIDTSALPRANSFDDVLEQLTWVYTAEHEFKTLVIDSIDWLERRVFEHVCKLGKKDSISDFGYGSGYTQSLEQLERVIRALSAIHTERDMGVMLLAHSQIKTFANPLGADYDRWVIKLRDKNTELFTEWVDLIGLIHFQVFTNTKKEGFGESTKAVGGTNRVLSCAPSAAYMAGNRYDITNDIELPDPQSGWNNLITAIKGA